MFQAYDSQAVAEEAQVLGGALQPAAAGCGSERGHRVHRSEAQTGAGVSPCSPRLAGGPFQRIEFGGQGNSGEGLGGHGA